MRQRMGKLTKDLIGNVLEGDKFYFDSSLHIGLPEMDFSNFYVLDIYESRYSKDCVSLMCIAEMALEDRYLVFIESDKDVPIVLDMFENNVDKITEFSELKLGDIEMMELFLLKDLDIATNCKDISDRVDRLKEFLDCFEEDEESETE